nr:unnamed protein product [Callosobruchus analis]
MAPPDTTIEKSLSIKTDKTCIHCSKSVLNSVNCIKCGGIFHPSCLQQSASKKNAICIHVAASNDQITSKSSEQEIELLRILIKELQSKNNILEENACLLREKSIVWRKH